MRTSTIVSLILPGGEKARAFSDNWGGTASNGWAIVNGVAVHTPGAGGTIFQVLSGKIRTGRVYTVTFECTVTASSFIVYLRGAQVGPSISTPGLKRFRLAAGASGSSDLSIEANVACDVTVSSLSIR